MRLKGDSLERFSVKVYVIHILLNNFFLSAKMTLTFFLKGNFMNFHENASKNISFEYKLIYIVQHVEEAYDINTDIYFH